MDDEQWIHEGIWVFSVFLELCGGLLSTTGCAQLQVEHSGESKKEREVVVGRWMINSRYEGIWVFLCSLSCVGSYYRQQDVYSCKLNNNCTR